VDASLRDDFGFQHLLWVYSGRRGVHCWVCDTKARRLTNEQRTSVAEFFAVSKGGEPGARKARLELAAMGAALTSLSRRSGRPFRCTPLCNARTTRCCARCGSACVTAAARVQV
jgi:DNA primase catalytic subunit